MHKKVILITGCSSGFGLLTAAGLVARGHHVYATMRDVSKSADLEKEVSRQGGAPSLTVLPLDVTSPSSIQQAVQHIMLKHGVIDVLINNAGFGMGGFFEDLSDADYQAQFDANFFGVLKVTREVVKVMRPQKKGTIINISSMIAFSGTPALSAYCSSKWALEGFSECLYIELKPFNIDVVLVEPGAYRTKIFEQNARYGSLFSAKTSPYYHLTLRLKNIVEEHARNNKKDPGDVARLIENIVEKRSYFFRYQLDFSSWLRKMIVRHLPFKIYAWIVVTALHSQKKDHFKEGAV